MADPAVFRIETDGTFALLLVDKADAGYHASWQAPDGKRLDAVAVADYDSDSGSWKCQVFASALTASPNVQTTDRKGTLCAPPAQSVTVGEDTFQIEIGYFQDPHVADGLTAFLFEHRTKEAYVLFGADGDDPPRAVGRCRLTSGNIGGDTHTDLEAQAVFPLLTAPDIEFGTAAASRIVRGDGLANSVTAGNPGAFVPAGAAIPANLAALQASGIKPIPLTNWTTGQRIVLGDGSNANWNGTAWVTGAHA